LWPGAMAAANVAMTTATELLNSRGVPKACGEPAADPARCICYAAYAFVLILPLTLALGLVCFLCEFAD
jgi:hypothetical protein